jgi:hypothetical protein
MTQANALHYLRTIRPLFFERTASTGRVRQLCTSSGQTLPSGARRPSTKGLSVAVANAPQGQFTSADNVFPTRYANVLMTDFQGRHAVRGRPGENAPSP